MIDILPLFKSINTAGIPTESLVVGKEEDRSTWRIIYKKGVTEEQKKIAQRMLEVWEPKQEKKITIEERVTLLEEQVKILLGGLHGRVY